MHHKIHNQINTLIFPIKASLMPDLDPSQAFQRLFGLVLYILAIINVYKILRQELNPPAAAAWILLNLAFPPIGVPLYFLLGQNKLKGYLKRRLETKQYLITHHPAGRKANLDSTIQNDEQGKKIFPSATISYNAINILDSGPKAFDAIFDAISQAKSYIFVQYYIFRPDSLGEKFKDLLISKAKDGVKIFFIFDNIGSVGLTGRYIRDLKSHGIKVARFLPFHFRFHLQVNFRNHRKLVLIDGDIAFVGGMNVGKEYLGKGKFWRDTQISIKGPAIASLAETFLEDWSFAVEAKKRYLPSSFVSRTIELYQHEKITTNNAERVATEIISFGPGDDADIGLYLFMDLIQSAEKSIFIATPYFIPDIVLERCLESALRRGVVITLLVPKKPDYYSIKFVSALSIRRFSRAGGRVFYYQKGFMHQKIMLIDEKVSMLGTSNFDNRSIYLNFETCVLVRNKEFAQKVSTMLTRDLNNASPMQPKPTESRWSLLMENIARLLSPLF